MDDIVPWDEAGDDTAAFTANPWVGRIVDRNEPTLRSGCRATRSVRTGLDVVIAQHKSLHNSTVLWPDLPHVHGVAP